MSFDTKLPQLDLHNGTFYQLRGSHFKAFIAASDYITDDSEWKLCSLRARRANAAPLADTWCRLLHHQPPAHLYVLTGAPLKKKKQELALTEKPWLNPAGWVRACVRARACLRGDKEPSITPHQQTRPIQAESTHSLRRRNMTENTLLRAKPATSQRPHPL